MIEKIKSKMFPCSEKMKVAMEENIKATQRLIDACRVDHKFPELKDGKIVSPR